MLSGHAGGLARRTRAESSAGTVGKKVAPSSRPAVSGENGDLVLRYDQQRAPNQRREREARETVGVRERHRGEQPVLRHQTHRFGELSVVGQ